MHKPSCFFPNWACKIMGNQFMSDYRTVFSVITPVFITYFTCGVFFKSEIQHIIFVRKHVPNTFQQIFYPSKNLCFCTFKKTNQKQMEVLARYHWWKQWEAFTEATKTPQQDYRLLNIPENSIFISQTARINCCVTVRKFRMLVIAQFKINVFVQTKCSSSYFKVQSHYSVWHQSMFM